jgi:hypothetical protein
LYFSQVKELLAFQARLGLGINYPVTIAGTAGHCAAAVEIDLSHLPWNDAAAINGTVGDGDAAYPSQGRADTSLHQTRGSRRNPRLARLPP